MPEKEPTETEVGRNRKRSLTPRTIESADADEPMLPDDPAKDDDEDVFKPLDRQKP